MKFAFSFMTALVTFFGSAPVVVAQEKIVIRDTVYIKVSDEEVKRSRPGRPRPPMRRTADPGVSRSKPENAVNYGRNVISIMPMVINSSGPGLGFSYEAILGEDQRLGIILPVAATFTNEGEIFFNEYRKFNTIHISPGLKMYVAGANRKVSYAIGPLLAFSSGKGETTVYKNGSDMDVEVKRQSLGMIINNYLNFQVGRNFNFGMDGGFGLRYFDKTVGPDIKSTTPMKVMGQFSFRMGARF